jgi:hypothetical protein
MQDEVITENEVTNEDQPSTNLSENLQAAMWGDEKPVAQQPVQPEKKDEPPVENKPNNDELVVPKDWLKKEFDIEDPAVLKAEREELKKLKENPSAPAEIKFANEQSRLLVEYLKEGKEDEALEILNTKKRIDKITAGEVTESNASDIVKMAIKAKYKDYDDKDVERKFNKQFGVPKEPVYDELKETEDEFKERHNEWKDKVAEAKADIILEAKTVKPDLQKLSTELIIPDIFKKGEAQQPSQEDLEAEKVAISSFIKSAEESVNSFSGFGVSVKDKDVDLSANYTPSKEEKAMVSERLKTFAESGFNANSVLADRWVNKDGKSINVNQMTEDLSRILFGEKAAQTVSADVVNQRMELYLKEKKNINVTETDRKGDFAPAAKSSSEKLQESFWGN